MVFVFWWFCLPGFSKEWMVEGVLGTDAPGWFIREHAPHQIQEIHVLLSDIGLQIYIKYICSIYIKYCILSKEVARGKQRIIVRVPKAFLFFKS